MGTGLLTVVFDRETLITNKIVLSHVAYYNFTTHENKSGIACSSESIVCTALNAVVMSFKNPSTFFKLSPYCKKKLSAWGTCVSRFAFAFQAFPVIVRDVDSLFATEKVFRFPVTLFPCTIRN